MKKYPEVTMPPEVMAEITMRGAIGEGDPLPAVRRIMPHRLAHHTFEPEALKEALARYNANRSPEDPGAVLGEDGHVHVTGTLEGFGVTMAEMTKYSPAT